MSDRIIELNEEDEEISGPMGIWDFPVLNSAAEEPLIENITEEPVLDILAEQSVLTQGSDDSEFELNSSSNSEEIEERSDAESIDDKNVDSKTVDEIRSTPSTLRNRVKDPFQFTAVDVGDSKEVYSLELDSNEAILIEDIGNEWYKGLTFTLEIDGNKREYQRSVADPNEPRSVSILASNEITWTVENSGSQARDVGVLTDGQYISQEQYDELTEEDTESL